MKTVAYLVYLQNILNLSHGYDHSNIFTTAITDHFVICHADSAPQVIAIADNVEEKMYTQCNRKVVRAQGKENAFWIIMDFTNIVVHIFKTEYRQFYRLEELWADAIKTNYQDDKQ